MNLQFIISVLFLIFYISWHIFHNAQCFRNCVYYHFQVLACPYGIVFVVFILRLVTTISKLGPFVTLTDSQVTEEYCSYKSTYVTCDSFLSSCTGSHMARMLQSLLANDLFWPFVMDSDSSSFLLCVWFLLYPSMF